MTDKLKVTFKKRPRATGLHAVGHPWRDVDIKIKKKRCGAIYAPTYKKDTWDVAFMLNKTDTFTDDNPNCPWKHTKQFKFATEQEAREGACKLVEKLITSGYTFHFIED